MLGFEKRMHIIRKAEKAHSNVMYLDSNNYEDKYGQFNWLILIGATSKLEINGTDSDPWKQLDVFIKNKKTPILGTLLSYDLKNSRETLFSRNIDFTGFPLLACWEPETIIGEYRDGTPLLFGNCDEYLVNFNIDEDEVSNQISVELIPSLTKNEYLASFNKIQNALQIGDIYEMNFCLHFNAEVKELNPIALFKNLNSISPAPFSALIKYASSWLVCSSPERFLKKSGLNLVSQPIKGTVKKSIDIDENIRLMQNLKENQKERNENIMIVDLVRNDLSHFAAKHGVSVSELCEVYPFASVNHMISTVNAKLNNENDAIEALANAFPMGSMTGVPKIKALEIADELENFQRRLYSGSVGYIESNSDFDFNVVIRSITWNEKNGYFSLSAGSAITIQANGNDEYDECILKTLALFKALNNK
jgi:para-aminobenzoate synthetase component 1